MHLKIMWIIGIINIYAYERMFQMEKLIKGISVITPTYDFISGKINFKVNDWYDGFDNYYKNKVVRYDSYVLERICTALDCPISELVCYQK